MIGDLLADHIGPGSVAQITVELLDKVLDYPRVVAEAIAPHAAKFGLRRGDGVALLDHLLSLARYPDKQRMVVTARPTGLKKSIPRSSRPTLLGKV